MENNLLTLVSDGFREIRSKAVSHLRIRDAVVFLESMWNDKAAVPGPFLREALGPGASKAYFKKRPPPWFIGMTSEFRKAISKVDRKCQRRIVEALSDITENPTKLSGRTVQPLTGTLQGCWSFRLDDAQLIYFADQSSGDITLLAFASIGSPPKPSLRVLLLEDRDDFREVLHDYLVSRSYQLTSVPSGVEGLQEIMRSPFDLIICDMLMPRMGGEMFYHAVTRIRPAAGQRFIFFSGHKNNPAIERFFREVKAKVLYKPFNLSVLDSAIDDVFRNLG